MAKEGTPTQGSKPSSTAKRPKPSESDRAFRARRARRGRKSGFLRRRVLPTIGLGSVVFALLFAIAWAVGLVMNDRELWSQYLWWIPTGIVAIVLWTAIALSKLCEWIGTRLSGAHLRPLLLVIAVGVSLWLLAIEWRVHRFVFSSDPRASDPSARLLYWNLAAATADGTTDRVMAQQADVYILANPRLSNGRAFLMNAMREQARTWRDQAIEAAKTQVPPSDQDQSEAVPESADDSADASTSELADIPATLNHRRVARFANTIIVSRYPVIDSGWRAISELDTKWFWRPSSTGFEGVGYIVLDATQDLGGSLVIWVVDLPSNAGLHREEVMRVARNLVERGPATGQLEDGTAFPAPTLIVGDFNTPRGSASLRALVGDRESAFGQAGVGPSATWPRPIEQLAIDLVFVANSWRAHGYERVDLQHGLHRAVRVDVGPRRAP